MAEFLGRRFLVTGATGGLGMALCSHLHDHCGSPVVIGTGRDLNKPGATLKCNIAFAADLAEPSGLDSLASEIAKAGPLDGIVHCAGMELVLPLRLTNQYVYRRIMSTAEAAMQILQAAAKRGAMNDGASIVLVSSVAAHRGVPGMAAYAAAKGAIEAMARAAAVELAPRGIRVNCVAPGGFQSPMHDRITAGSPAPSVDAYKAAHPLGLGTTEPVVAAIVHLISDAARWTTGTTVVVDGGYLANHP